MPWYATSDKQILGTLTQEGGVYRGRDVYFRNNIVQLFECEVSCQVCTGE